MPAIRKILVPVDFSATSRAALEYALFMAEAFGAAVEMLYVFEPLPLLGDGVAKTPLERGDPGLAALEREAADDEMERLRREYTPRAKHGLTGTVESGHAAKTIVARLERREHDLAVMGTHGRTGLLHLWLGSVAENVVRHARCPVLTIHPQF